MEFRIPLHPSCKQQLKTMNYSIPKPCHENWNTMTPESKGRHCAVCQKCVIDFSKLSDIAVRKELKANAGKEVCGRFGSHQLERINALENSSSNTTLLKRTAAVAATVALLSTAGYSQTEHPKPPTQIEIVKGEVLGRIAQHPFIGEDAIQSTPKKVVLSGRVIDGANDPISNATVLVKGTDLKVLTDEDGYYELVLTSNKRKEVELIFTGEWTLSETRTVVLNQPKIEIEDQVLYLAIMGEIAVDPTSFLEKTVDTVKNLLS